nr:hypothetical protein [Deltaproteobacteria bacterium]
VLAQLAHLGLVAGSADPPSLTPDLAFRVRGNAPRARAAGLFVPDVAPGRSFRPGDLLGRILGVDGTELDALRADAAGIVVAWAEGGWVEIGGIPGTLGLEDADG